MHDDKHMHAGDDRHEGSGYAEKSNNHHAAASNGQRPSDARKVTVEATDFAFDPATITAHPGEKLFIELVNKGDAVHMWQTENKPETHVHTPVGETSSKVVQAPGEAGNYRIICQTPGHEERGMVGTLEVRKDAETTQSDAHDDHSH